jgi:DNA-binding transcriptional LysR family regulator
MSQPIDPTRESLNRTPLNDPHLLSGPYWDELRTFLAVAKSKSFNRAGAMLNKSQPSVSRSIHRLQSMVGSQLLVSSKKGIVLTERGRELAEALMAFDQRISSLSQNLGAESKEAAGTVRFSATEAIAGLFVIPLLPKFSREHPKIRLHVRNITNMTGFRENQSDIVLGFSPSTQAGVEARAVGYLHLLPYASKQYIARHGTPTSANLQDHSFLDAEYYSSRTETWREWRAAVDRGTLAHLCDNSFAYCLMVKEGMGIGLLGNYVMPDPELVPLDLGVRIDMPMYLMVETERLQSRPVRIVYDWLCTVFSQTNYWLSSEFSPAEGMEPGFEKTLSRVLLTDWTQGSPY